MQDQIYTSLDIIKDRKGNYKARAGIRRADGYKQMDENNNQNEEMSLTKRIHTGS